MVPRLPEVPGKALVFELSSRTEDGRSLKLTVCGRNLQQL